MQNFYLFDTNITKEDAYKVYIDTIDNDLRYDKKISEDLLTIEEKYFSYYFIESAIYNHPYFYHNKSINKEVDGKIDILYNHCDCEFILNELKKNKANKIDELDFDLFDANKFNNSYNKFIKSVKNKAISNILSRHSTPLSKQIHIDVSPIEKFDTCNIDSYYEKVYIFRYRSIDKKDDYISILSAYNRCFYKLDFVKSFDYNNYLLKYKRPIEYIPKDYLDFYHREAYTAYLHAMKALDYEEKGELLIKIKKNINYEAYSLHEKYLKMGVYFFKIRKYIKKINVIDSPLKIHIFYSYLTLRYNKDSGVFLYKCVSLGLLGDISINEKISFLLKSYRLKNLEAKKLLYEHYSSMDYYNELLVKKYS